VPEARRSAQRPIQAAALAMMIAAISSSSSATGLTCPSPTGNSVDAIEQVRAVLGEFRPDRAFDFAECAYEATEEIDPPDATDARAVSAYWRLVEDAVFILRSASDVARSTQSRQTFLANERKLRERFLDAYGSRAPEIRSGTDWARFVKDYGDNLQRLGSPHARDFVLRVSDLGPYVLGPDGTASYIRAIESCAAWDFTAGASRTTADENSILCSPQCIEERLLAEGLLKEVRLNQARIATRKLQRVASQCPEPVAGGESVTVGARPR